jgi:hypothetical protein
MSIVLSVMPVVVIGTGVPLRYRGPSGWYQSRKVAWSSAGRTKSAEANAGVRLLLLNSSKRRRMWTAPGRADAASFTPPCRLARCRRSV